jgi:hypothetical protein
MFLLYIWPLKCPYQLNKEFSLHIFIVLNTEPMQARFHWSCFVWISVFQNDEGFWVCSPWSLNILRPAPCGLWHCNRNVKNLLKFQSLMAAWHRAIINLIHQQSSFFFAKRHLSCAQGRLFLATKVKNARARKKKREPEYNITLKIINGYQSSVNHQSADSQKYAACIKFSPYHDGKNKRTRSTEQNSDEKNRRACVFTGRIIILSIPFGVGGHQFVFSVRVRAAARSNYQIIDGMRWMLSCPLRLCSGEASIFQSERRPINTDWVSEWASELASGFSAHPPINPISHTHTKVIQGQKRERTFDREQTSWNGNRKGSACGVRRLPQEKENAQLRERAFLIMSDLNSNYLTRLPQGRLAFFTVFEYT